jgi:hypothetical protein
MEWVAAAEEYIGSFGWGGRGRNLGVSRMFGEGDKASLSRNKFVATLRPRGILSGFLAILPGRHGEIVYVPPIAAKVPPQRIRLRVSPALAEAGAIFSAYLTRAEAGAPRRLVLEDVLVWRGEPVWISTPFRKRWNTYMKLFVTQEFTADPVLQGLVIELANYVPLAALKEPSDKQVAEFVPDDPGVKRLIWKAPDATLAPASAPAHVPVPPTVSAIAPGAAATGTTVRGDGFVAKKEAGMGPDVYAVYRGAERLGLALVRTLAISRALRLAVSAEKTEVPIRAAHNKTFEKYEVLEVLSAA